MEWLRQSIAALCRRIADRLCPQRRVRSVWDLHLCVFAGCVHLDAGAVKLALDPGEAKMLGTWCDHAASAAVAFDLLQAAGVPATAQATSAGVN